MQQDINLRDDIGPLAEEELQTTTATLEAAVRHNDTQLADLLRDLKENSAFLDIPKCVSFGEIVEALAIAAAGVDAWEESVAVAVLKRCLELSQCANLHVNTTTGDRKKILDVAVDNANWNIVQVLLEHKAVFDAPFQLAVARQLHDARSADDFATIMQLFVKDAVDQVIKVAGNYLKHVSSDVIPIK